MNKKNFGICLYQKESMNQNALKDLMQLVRTHNLGKSLNFSYVEATSSLLPDLSLWENIQLELGGSSWEDLTAALVPEWRALMTLITNPHLLTVKSQPWEKFATSLLKGTLGQTPHLLVDMNENLLPPMLIQHFKRVLMTSVQEKNVYVASAHTSVWLDCAHTMVRRQNYEFEAEILDLDQIKKHWAA